MANKNEKCVQTFDTDELAVTIFRHLSKDFKSVHGKTFADAANKKLSESVAMFRSYQFPSYMGTSVPRFRAWYQLEHLFKKYRFQDDAYADEQLEEISIEKYLSNQVTLCAHRAVPTRAYLVFQRARAIASAILGPFDAHLSQYCCRFGKNSSIGCPFSLSYLDVKLTSQEAHTGSADGIKAFYEDYLPGDPILTRILSRHSIKKPEPHESLSLINVPKTWKTLRSITPLTLLTLFRTYGIGGLIERALERAGMPIPRLQRRHQRMIKEFSKNLSHVTMDLSAASDSITSEMLNRVLPRQWYNVVKATTTHKVMIDDREFYTASILPMGNGLTFPLETLVFYSLVKAVGELVGVNGFYSAYGDDLIFPRGIYSYVCTIFNDIGLKVNVDKTYASASFRESCGADYYTGADVRPYFLPNGGLLTRSQYTVYLYKVINGLLRRWSPEEIPETIRRLLIELTMVDGRILRVPPSFPDTAGLKIELGGFITSWFDCLPFAPIKVSYRHGSRSYSFLYYRSTSRKRAVLDVEPFYWDRLRDPDQNTDQEPWDIFGERFYFEEPPASPLSWRVCKKQRTYHEKGWMRKKLVKSFIPEIVAKEKQPRYRVLRGPSEDVLISDWI